VCGMCGGVGGVGVGGGRCGGVGGVGGVGSLLTFDIPQTALVATLDTYDFYAINKTFAKYHISSWVHVGVK
jgi:hypothetical protein